MSQFSLEPQPLLRSSHKITILINGTSFEINKLCDYTRFNPSNKATTMMKHKVLNFFDALSICFNQHLIKMN